MKSVEGQMVDKAVDKFEQKLDGLVTKMQSSISRKGQKDGEVAAQAYVEGYSSGLNNGISNASAEINSSPKITNGAKTTRQAQQAGEASAKAFTKAFTMYTKKGETKELNLTLSKNANDLVDNMQKAYNSVYKRMSALHQKAITSISKSTNPSSYDGKELNEWQKYYEQQFMIHYDSLSKQLHGSGSTSSSSHNRVPKTAQKYYQRIQALQGLTNAADELKNIRYVAGKTGQSLSPSKIPISDDYLSNLRKWASDQIESLLQDVTGNVEKELGTRAKRGTKITDATLKKVTTALAASNKLYNRGESVTDIDKGLSGMSFNAKSSIESWISKHSVLKGITNNDPDSIEKYLDKQSEKVATGTAGLELNKNFAVGYAFLKSLGKDVSKYQSAYSKLTFTGTGDTSAKKMGGGVEAGASEYIEWTQKAMHYFPERARQAQLLAEAQKNTSIGDLSKLALKGYKFKKPDILTLKESQAQIEPEIVKAQEQAATAASEAVEGAATEAATETAKAIKGKKVIRHPITKGPKLKAKQKSLSELEDEILTQFSRDRSNGGMPELDWKAEDKSLGIPHTTSAKNRFKKINEFLTNTQNHDQELMQSIYGAYIAGDEDKMQAGIKDYRKFLQQYMHYADEKYKLLQEQEREKEKQKSSSTSEEKTEIEQAKETGRKKGRAKKQGEQEGEAEATKQPSSTFKEDNQDIEKAKETGRKRGRAKKQGEQEGEKEADSKEKGKAVKSQEEQARQEGEAIGKARVEAEQKATKKAKSTTKSKTDSTKKELEQEALTIEKLAEKIEQSKTKYRSAALKDILSEYENPDHASGDIATKIGAYDASRIQARVNQSEYIQQAFSEYQKMAKQGKGLGNSSKVFKEYASRYLEATRAVEHYEKQLQELEKEEQNEARIAEQLNKERQAAEKREQSTSNLKKAIQGRDKGRVISQTGVGFEDGTSWTEQRGVATKQTFRINEDEEGNLTAIGDPAKMNFDALTKAIIKADTEAMNLAREMDIIQNKYQGIDMSPWQEEMAKIEQTQTRLMDEAGKFAISPDYMVGYKQFLQDRAENLQKVSLELRQKNTLDKERESLAVEAGRTALGKKISGIHSKFQGTEEFKALQDQVAGAKSLADLEKANNAYNKFLTTINSIRDLLKSSSGTMDPIQNAFGRREQGTKTIEEYIQKFQMIGLSAEEAEAKVKPLAIALASWQKIDVNAKGGMKEFGTAAATFNTAERNVQNELVSTRNQKTIDAKIAKQEKSVNIQNYKSLLVAIKDVTRATKELQSVEQQAAKNPFQDYSAQIEQARMSLDGYKLLLESILKETYNAEKSDLTSNFFGRADFLDPNQISSFQKALDDMQKAESSLDANRINSLRDAYTEYYEAVRRYGELLADNADGSQNEELAKQEEKIKQLKEAYGELSVQMREALGKDVVNDAMSDLVKQAMPNLKQNMMKDILTSYSTELLKTKDFLSSSGLEDATSGIDALDQKILQLATDVASGSVSWGQFIFRLSTDGISSELAKISTIQTTFEQAIQQLNSITTQNLSKQGISIIAGLKENLITAINDVGTESSQELLANVLQRLAKFKEEQSKYSVSNENGLLIGDGQIQTLDQMTASMDAYAKSAQLGKLVSESVDKATGQVARTYQSANGQIITLKGSLDQLNNGWRMQMSSAQAAGSVIKNVISSFSGMGKAIAYMVSMHAVMSKLRQEMTQGLNTFKQFDSTLTNISYTMNLSQKELQNMGQAAVDMAQDLSLSVSNAESIFQIYANMNTSAQEIQETAKPTAILSNLSGVDASTAADEVQGILEQFNMLKDGEADVAETSMHVVDVLDNISANVAMDYAKGIGVITQAVTATGQVAHDAGMSFEQLAAISAKVAERTREDGSTIGNAIKTIITRTSKVGKMPEYEDEVDNETLSKAAESLSKVGIEVYKTNGEMNDIDVTISKLREKWDDLTDAQQSNIAFNIAATRQTSKFKNILEAWDESMALAETASTAEGNALANQEKYEESMVGKMQQMQSQLDEFWIHFYNSDAVNGILDFLVNVTKGINDLSDAITPLGVLLTGIVGLGVGGGLVKTLVGGVGELFNVGVLGEYNAALTQNIALSAMKQMTDEGRTQAEISAAVAAITGKDALIGMNAEELKGAVAGQTFAAAQAKAAASARLLGGLKIAAIIAGVAVAIYAAKKAYDEFSMSTDALIKRNDNLVKEDKEKIKSLQDEKKSYDDNVKTLSDLLSQYQEATVGSEEYYNIRQQIADQFPELITGYDSEGRAIIATNDQIQTQIDKYKELSMQKQLALKQQAKTDIDEIVGYQWGQKGKSATDIDTSQRNSYSTLLKRKQELIANRNNDLENVDTSKDGITERRWDREQREWIEIKHDSDTAIANINKAYSGELEEVQNQILENKDALKEYYSILADVPEGATETELEALSNLQEISSLYGATAIEFQSNWNKIRSSVQKDEKADDFLSNLINPDLSQIEPDQYADYMNKALEQAQKKLHFNNDQFDFLKEALNIDENEKQYIDQLDFVKNEWKDKFANVGLDIENILKDINISDLYALDPEQIITDHFTDTITKKWGNNLKDIKELTVSNLQSIDWNQAVTDPALKSFRGLANMAVDWGLADNIQEAISLFGQMGLVVDDTAEGMQTAFTTFSTDFENSMTQMATASDKVKTALSEQTSQGSISADTYKELIAANSNYKDAIVETATGIQLNTDKVKELQKQEQQSRAKELSSELQDLYKQYLDNDKQIYELTQKLKENNFVGEENAESVNNQIAALYEAQAAVQDNISTWTLYRDQLLAATNAWNEWQTAQASANASDPYKSMKSAWDNFEEAHKQGWVGTDDYLSYARLLTGVTDEDTLMSDKLFEQAKKTQERYFTDNIKGVYNFMNDAEEVLKKNGLTDWFTEEGGLRIKNDELFTSLFSEYMQGKGMAGISLEGLQQIMAAVKDAGWGDLEAWGTYADQASYIQDSITWMEKQQAELEESDPKWQQYADMIANANQQLTELEIKQKQFKTPEELNKFNQIANEAGTNTQVTLPTTFTTADQARTSLLQLGQQKSEMIEMGIDINSDQYQAVLAEIDYVYAQWQKLNEPAIMQIDSSQLDEVDGQYVQLVQDAVAAAEAYQSALHQFQNGTGDLATVNAAKSSADAKASLVQSFEGEHPELKVKLGLEEGTMAELNGKIAESGDQLAEAFKIDDNVMSGVIKSIDDTGVSADTAKGKIEGVGTAITTLPTVGNLGFTSLNSYVSTANTNVGNLAGKINNLPSKKTVEISVKTSGSVPKGITGLHGTTGFSSGTVKFHPFGKAAAQGDIGAKKTETALVGELGPEMRVRGSRWELLGENGAEFSDIRRGDIIFNHKQTAELLRNGYISSRGQMAFVGGTAFAGKGKDWKNADNVKRVKSSSKSSKTSTKSKDSGNSKSKSNDKDDKKKTSKLQDWLSKLFDWIEVKIDRTQKAIDNAISKAESYVSMIPATLDRITTGANGLFDANRYKETADEVARYVAKAIGQYTNALSSTYSQISTQNQAVTKYESLASTARKKGLSGLSSKNKKTAKKALKILDKDGTIDVSKYNDKVKEVIEGVKQWKDKAIEARAAINDLNDKVRDYVKSLKETVDAQRDAHTSLAEWSVSSVNATFEATNDNNASYSVSRLDLENNQLMVQNKAYAQATSTMSGQVTSIGKTASKVGIYDGLSKKQQKAIKKDKKGKSEYEKALQNAKNAIKDQKEISLFDLDTIQKYNPTVYAKMIAWNEALNQLDITRQEEITAYTQNYNKIAENIVEKYNKMDEATNNDIELYTKQIDNATSDKGKNKLLQNQIDRSQELRAHAQSRVADFNDLKKNSAGRLNKFTKGSMRTSKSMTDSDTKIINALFNRIQNTVNNGKAISASDLNTVFELYRKGYIQASYYKACTDWNISVERYEEAKRAQQLVEETVRQENATRELQKIQNIQQQSENNRQMNEQRKTEANARISKAEAYGHYAKPEDYTAQIEKENSNLQDLIAKREEARQTLHKAVEVGNIRIGDDEWYEAVNVINSMTNAINETDLSIKNLKNSLRQLNWDIFDDGMKEIAKLNKEIEHYLNIISNERFFDEDDRGNITQYGLAALEVHNTAYELNIQQAQKYAQEVEELQKRFKLAKEDENWLDSTDAKNQERLQELLEQEWQLVEATEAEKQAIIDLVKQGYDAQLSALNTSISKYKELKQAEKDAYDYQKKITDQTKNILSLEKQLAAFEANSSAESVATVQKLRADLDEAKQQVKDDQYDMYMSEMNNMLDDLSNNFQEWIDYYMKDRDRVLNDAKEYLAGNIDDLGKHSDMATAVTTFKDSAVKLIRETNTDVTQISNNLTPLLEANQAVKTKVETIATGVSTIIGEFQKMVKEQSQPMVQGLDTLIATANDEASYQKQVAQNASTGSSKGTMILTPEQERKQAEEARLRAEQERIRQEDEENRRRWLAEQERIKDEEARMKAEYEAKKAEDQRLAKLEAESKKAGTYIKSIATSTTVSAKANAISAKKMSGSAAAAALAGAKMGFKKGSRRISENQWAWTQEDGTEAIYRKSDNALLTPLGAGDKVFTAGMTDNLWKLAKMNLPEMISNSFKQPIVSNSNTNARTNGGDVQFIFNLPGVKDYDSFKSALIADKNFQNAVQTMTLGAASGKNSLSKFKYS